VLATADDMYLIKARTDEEAEEWFLQISKAIRSCNRVNEGQGDILKHNKAGNLLLNNEPKFLVIRSGVVTISDSDDSMGHKLELDLQNFTCTFTPPSPTFTVSSNDGTTTYEWTSPYGHNDAALWVKTFQSHIHLSKNQLFSKETEDTEQVDVRLTGWLIIQKTGKKRYFSLMNTLLTYYTDDPSKGGAVIEGSIDLVGATIAKPKTGPNMTFAIRDSLGIFVGLRGTSNQAEVDKWIQTLLGVFKTGAGGDSTTAVDSKIENLEGWVERKFVGKKKTQRVFLVAHVIRGFTLRFFDTQNYGQSRAEEEIYLASCRCSRLDPTTFVITPGGQSESFHFSTLTEDETKKWVQVISKFISSANHELSKNLIKHQWMMQIIGKTVTPRWVVISRQRQLLCFPKLLSPDNIVSPNATAYMDLYGATALKGSYAGKPSFTVQGQKGVSMLLATSGDEKQCESWVNQINSLVNERGPIQQKSLTFGIPLSELIEREGTVVPTLVTRCIDYIVKNGADQQGVFRLSGSSSEIKEYTDILDEGQEVNFRNADVHAVTGVLKLFLRSLPDSLFPNKLYHQYIDTVEPGVLRALVLQLPEANYNLAQVLFHFLYKMAKYSDVTSMDSSNIAIVFGPNVLINKQADDLQKLQDTPQILKTTRAMIDDCHTIFPKKEEITTDEVDDQA